jgi:hypothetical protein
MPERELTAPVDLCAPGGALSEAAVGWSRRPLHRCNLSGRFPRKKRWEYWCVASDEALVAFTMADLDYLGLAAVTFLDLSSRRLMEKAAVTPLGLGCRLGETVCGADVDFARSGVQLAFSHRPGATRLRAAISGRLTAEIEVVRQHETLNVVAPWSARCFQFTSKQFALPATGAVEVEGRRYRFGPGAFACLDFGRGIWPWRTEWFWACAAGGALGLNLGGLWTRGTGMTENALLAGGRLRKLDEELDFIFDDAGGPWRVRAPSGRVDLEVSPIYSRTVGRVLAPLGAKLHWAFGSFRGTVDGLRIDDLRGWIEHFRARW